VHAGRHGADDVPRLHRQLSSRAEIELDAGHGLLDERRATMVVDGRDRHRHAEWQRHAPEVREQRMFAVGARGGDELGVAVEQQHDVRSTEAGPVR
jgi:hypothetical protein